MINHNNKIDFILGSPFINQAEYELFGAVWSDKSGRVRLARIRINPDGTKSPDLPDKGVVNFRQVGIRKC
jgi:hypothetical protein